MVRLIGNYELKNGSKKHINVTIGNGQMVVVAGLPNAGKTSFLRSIIDPEVPIALESVDKSQVLYEGIHCTMDDRKTILQNFEHYYMAYQIEYNPTDLVNYLRAELDCNPQSIVDGFPRSIKKLLCIIRLVYASPSLLILDEPSSQMDEYSCKIFFSTLQNFLKNGGKALLITHDMRLIQKASTIILFSQVLSVVSKKSKGLGIGIIKGPKKPLEGQLIYEDPSNKIRIYMYEDQELYELEKSLTSSSQFFWTFRPETYIKKLGELVSYNPSTLP